MKSKLKKIKTKIVERGPKSGLAKQMLISMYILALRMFTNFGKLKSKIYEVIGENRPELEGNKKATRKLFREIKTSFSASQNHYLLKICICSSLMNFCM